MLQLPALLGFGFTNLAMLGWLAAAAAPLLIHLWSRHRHREAPWAAMQFLLAAMRKNARRMQLQQWLMLAVRTLIIVLVVLAVAEPYGEQLLAGGSNGPAHKVLIIDGSFSMAYRDGGVSSFDRARQLAAALVRDSGPADAFTLILMAAPSKRVAHREMVDRAAVIARIEALTQPHTGADLPGALTLIQESLAGHSMNGNSTVRHELYFFTDLQRTTWDQVREAPNNSGKRLYDRMARLAEHAALMIVDVGRERAANLAVTDISSDQPFITTARESVSEVTIRQFGTESRQECTVELLVDNLAVSEQMIEVPAGGEVALRFTHRFESPGEHIVAARVAGDDLNIDNVRRLVVPVREEVRVLCIEGRAGAARYIADALNPNPAAESPIQPVVVSEGELADLELPDFDCVFLCNVAQLTPDEARRLAQYAAAGGGVVFFLGDRVVAANYNALASDEPALLPASLRGIVAQPQFGLDPLDYRHPIVAPFRGRERAGLLTTPVSRYYRLDVPESRADTEIVVAVSNGDPFIVSAPLGRGRTVVVATAASLASVDAAGEPWTHWPTWPSFLPIVRELLAHAAGGRQQDWQQLVGAPIGGQIPLASDTTLVANERPLPLKIERPDGRIDAVSIESTPAGWEWSYSVTDLSGVYTLHGLPQDQTRPFAVNIDAAESDLTRLDRQQLPAEWMLRDSLRAASHSAEGAGIGRTSPTAWSQSLLWSALAMLFFESFLASRLGRGGV